jgi:hypothetical protein
VVENHIPDVFLIGYTVAYNVPHGDTNTAEEKIKYGTVGKRHLDGEKIDKIKNGKVDPRDEGPQTEINGNGSFIEKNRVLHTPQFIVQ